MNFLLLSLLPFFQNLMEPISGEIIFRPESYIIPEANATLFAVMEAGLGVVGLIFCIIWVIKKKDYIPFYVWLGGIPMAIVETFADLNGHLWWAVNLPGPAFTSFSTSLPLIVILAYCGFCTICYVGYYYFKKGMTKKSLFLLWAILCIAEGAFEIPLTSSQAWIYYGFSPFKVFGFPLWWAWINGTGFFFIAFLIWIIKPYVSGWKNTAIILTPLLGFSFTYGFLALPNWIAINYPIPVILSYVVSLLSLFICIMFVRFLANIMATDSTINAKAVSGFLEKVRGIA